MEKKLSAWCKNAKIEMINRDLKTTTLAKELDMNRSYVSSILNGRVYSAPAVKRFLITWGSLTVTPQLYD